jgi:hypothetical protein
LILLNSQGPKPRKTLTKKRMLNHVGSPCSHRSIGGV